MTEFKSIFLMIMAYQDQSWQKRNNEFTQAHKKRGESSR